MHSISQRFLSIVEGWFCVLIILTSCSSPSPSGELEGGLEGDTLQLKYADHLTIVRCEDYISVQLADPWNEGNVLHTYLLVPKKKELPDCLPEGTVVRTPLRRAVVSTSVHCGLINSFGASASIAGVCDRQYIHLPFVDKGIKEGRIADCGSALSPALEHIVETDPDAIFLSPFQNSGGYGRLEKLNIPIIETADYMETSPLGRAEWMRFYGLLFGQEQEADSIFRSVEKEYQRLCRLAQTATSHPTVLMDKQTGSVWYVPGGNSTIGHLIVDANTVYPWADDTHSGSLELPFEGVLGNAAEADIWFFRYNAPKPITKEQLLSEHRGYDQFRAYQSGQVYGCNTATSAFYEETPFAPQRLLLDFITIAHPELQLGTPRYFHPIKE